MDQATAQRCSTRPSTSAPATGKPSAEVAALPLVGRTMYVEYVNNIHVNIMYVCMYVCR